MRDRWIRRSGAVLAGGLAGAYVSEKLWLWVLAVLLLLGVRLLWWRPLDFFGKVYRPEALLLAVSLLFGFMYGGLAGKLLPAPLTVDQAEISGVLKDWNPGSEKCVGTVLVAGAKIGNAVQADSGQADSGRTGSRQTGDEQGTGPDDLAAELKGQTYQLIVYPNKLREIPDAWKAVRPGDVIRFTARLERPKPVGTEGAFDLRVYDAVRGLSGSMTGRGDAVLLAEGKPSLAWSIRQNVYKQLEAWDSPETGVLEGILFGDSSRIPQEIQERYKVTGVLHVFAASGSNVAFVLGLAWLILWFAPKPVRIGGSILALLLYAVLCGGNSPIVRATVLGVAVLLGRIGRGRVASLRWLFFAGLGLFALNPLVIRDLGFQLSFAAAWGIVVLAPGIEKTARLARVPALLRSASANTLAAQAAVLPLLIAAFHRLSLSGLLVNVFLLFLLGGVLELGLCGVMLGFCWWLAAPLFQVCLWLLTVSDQILKFVASLPYADVYVVNPGPLFWLVWYGSIGVELIGEERFYFRVQVALLSLKRRLKEFVPANIAQGLRKYRDSRFAPSNGLAGRLSVIPKNSFCRRLGGILILLLLLRSPWNLRNNLEVDMIDVGQGDSILIRTPENHAVLIDAGPRSDTFDAGERIVLPYLLQTGVRHLDAALITHEDRDHIGGIRSVLDVIPVDWIGVPDVGERLTNDEWKAGLPENISLASPKLRTLGAGDCVELDSGAVLEVAGPGQVLENTHSDSNNNCLVMKLEYRGQTFLLTGDMEQEEMEEIAANGVDLEDDIFKEPHHGSRFSLDKPLLDRIHPQAVLISVGKNTYGHPAPEVLEYWQERGIPVYRTDRYGTIKLLVDDDGIKIVPGRQID